VCSGIEAASVAWESLGWTPVAFAEIEKFPSKVLAHHYPAVANLGDMTRFREWDIERGSVDLLVGGTPCQSFSVAGLRKGLDDPRGNLALTFIAMVEHYRPEWIIWENVPGVLSSSGGRDFGSLLGALVQLGYGFTYRVLDAQYFGVPQRRRRVFVVAHSSGDSRRAAEVLFEPESLRGDSTKSNRKGEKSTASPVSSVDANGIQRPVMYENHPNDSRITGPVDPIPTVAARWGTGGGNTPLVQHTFRKSRRAQSAEDFETWVSDGVTNTLNCFDLGDIRSVDIVVESFAQNQLGELRTSPIASTLGTNSNASGRNTPMVMHQTHAFNHQSGGDMRGIDLREYPQLQAHQQTSVLHGMAVRRLTPTECERLQGFPDGYTDIMPETPDGPRYKALGNSMAVPVMRWIGSRIALATK
jgi:DNA (cytosine-5)-methyltransferase 1